MRFLYLALLAFIFGCAPTGSKDIIAQYKNNARSVGITPVYPPEEWLQVGDIFVQSVPKTASPRSLRTNTNDEVKVFFDFSPEFVKEAETFMGSRLAFLRTKASPVSDGGAQTQADIHQGQFATRRDRSIETLPIVAFPEVTADAGSNFGFSLVRLFQAIGLGASNRTQVILNFNDVRKYGIPKLYGYDAAFGAAISSYTRKAKKPHLTLEQSVNNLHVQVADTVSQELLDQQARLRLLKEGSGSFQIEERCNRFLVVTEVYLTRKITYTFTDASILAIAAKRLSESEEGETSKANDAPTAAQTNIIFSNPSGQPADSPVTIVDPDGLRTAVAASISGQKVGEGLVFDTFTARGARFYQEFERPVVIGYEAISVGFPTKNFLLQQYAGNESFEDCLL